MPSASGSRSIQINAALKIPRPIWSAAIYRRFRLAAPVLPFMQN
jgi:hypothetical protein